MDLGVPPGQRRGAAWDPPEVFARLGILPGDRRPVRQPPQQDDANGDGDDAIHQEHPLEADVASFAVHLLEPGGHQAHDRGGDLRSGVVLADALSGARWRIEEGEIVGHPGPHTGNDNTQEKTEETCWSAFVLVFSTTCVVRTRAEGEMGDILEAPGGFHGRQTSPNHPHTDDNAAHPNMRAQTRHDQVGRQIEDDVTHVEQRQTSRDLMRRHFQHGPQIMLRVRVHRLRQTNIRPDGRAEEVEDPERGDDPEIQLSEVSQYK